MQNLVNKLSPDYRLGNHRSDHAVYNAQFKVRQQLTLQRFECVLTKIPYADFYSKFGILIMLSNERECKCKTAKIDRHIKGAKVPGNESSRDREQKGLGTKEPGSELAREREGQGAKGPGSERARERKFQGANWPGSYWPIRSGERIGPGAKRLGTRYGIPLSVNHIQTSAPTALRS